MSYETLPKMDVCLVRNVFDSQKMAEWLVVLAAEKEHLSARQINPFNPPAVAGDIPSGLRCIARSRDLIKLMWSFLGDAGRLGVSLYNERLLVKDALAHAPVFLHQDAPYHQGLSGKWSAFVAITDSYPANGGLCVYPGTAAYGCLGDAGEIDQGLPRKLGLKPFCPDMAPGDVLFMDSCVWHSSGPNETSIDRVLLDIIFQPSNDPTGIELLAGRWNRSVVYTRSMRDAPLVRSRVSRIKALEAELAALKGKK